ncbi:MAG: DUF4013 domain-containing protein [Actinobacteria bacterium]|nr:MAG: DUF4013 domain-containing protein [Actinomycetota bacterium]
MDYAAAFSYMFQDKDWLKKILLGGLIFFVPILQFAAFGYAIKVLRNVKAGNATPLPEWDDIGGMFVSGIKYFVALILYALPAIIIMFILFALIFGAAAISSAGDAAKAVGPLIAVCSCFSYGVIMIYALVFMILLPEITIAYAETENISSAFEIKKIFNKTKVNIGPIIIIVLISYVANLIAGLGVILFFIGVIFTSFWAYLVNFNLYGQLAAEQEK